MINISLNRWRHLVQKNVGKKLSYEIFVQKNDGTWFRYEPFTITISPDTIDGYLVYRLIDPAFKYWNEMGIYQRNLENFDEKP